MKKLRFTAAALTILFALGLAASAQSTAPNASKPAPNAWMLTPTPYLEWYKNISPSLRAERDGFWDGLSSRRMPLTAPSEIGEGTGSSFSADGPEIPDVLHRAILSATFAKHQSVLSASEFSMYTEATLRVDEVFDDQTGADRPAAQRDITLLLPGGTVLLRSGRTLSYKVAPSEMSLEPGHKYLLVMTYHQAGDFYTLADDWDVSDGTLRFNTRTDEYRAQHGLSSLSGLKVEQLGPALAKLLQEQK
jgi:hypothetical protein